MAPASSEEEEEQQGKEEADTVAPAAPERQHDVDSTVDERGKKKLIEEAIGSLGAGRARCSEMMEAARPGRGTGDLIKLRCVDFLEKELRYIVAGLTALSPQHVDEEMTAWLRRLTGTASDRLPRVIDQADLQRDNTLLRRASRFFRRRHRHPVQLLEKAKVFYSLAEDPRRYRHLLQATSRHGLPPQAAEEGGSFYLVTTAMGTSYDFPYEIDLPELSMIMFPYGHKFETDRLVKKWWYEACFRLPDDTFISRLVSRNVITHAAPNSRRRTNRPDEAETWQWNVNPIQYQFLASKSAEMGFVFTSATLNLLLAAGSSTGHGNEAGQMARRLALHQDDPNIPSLLQEIDLSQTRSLAVSGVVSIGVSLDKFVNLVVLDVEGWVNFGDEDLLQVCRSKMFFLEYLSVRNTRVSKLPPEINELCRLRLLDASKTQVTEIPFGVFVATRLYRLDLRGSPVRQLTLPKQILWLQDSLHELLLGGEGMIYSAETATRLPHDIRRFWRLWTLATVDLIEQPASFVKALGDLRYLKVLAITWSFHQSSDRDYCEALLSSIKRWSWLKSLTIHCGLGCSMEFLGSLSDMPALFDKFKVTLGRFVGVPQWFSGLKYLSFVQIIVCKQGARDLEILRDLRKLKCLILGLDFIPRKAIVIKNGGFHELQRFSIDCPVPWLTFESEAMPELTYLQLEFHACPTSPISVPSGISNLSSLKEVALWYNVRYANRSSVKMIVEAVREEVANRTQKISLFINGIEQDDAQEVDKETESTTGAPSGPDAGAEGEAVVEKTTAVVDTEITEAES
ncbi:hypothetical protein GQ55_8G224900 [Panicum hallii var. hallii]|uniref:Disease resistance R13L4/SHOC-2-like LRR domain-containing protein n=1 Tax=Panicum hallii var. hallii TaxID=1504633 RepID=A0A2T7CQ63_9POAL|nr:hypothetical protein GQ55_8G224900 [Panicum hallii var. hallii]PUZ45457.1 hypothetical protein GQ55_8G224900 [Panicum hallii var. hallii]PUZ45458.1 hypothetical protein GQ55_8G224900 [Panicum hallii var. hallii]